MFIFIINKQEWLIVANIWVTNKSDLNIGTPTLSNSVVNVVNNNQLNLSVDVDNRRGILYWIVSESNTKPAAHQIIKGRDHIDNGAVDTGRVLIHGGGPVSIMSSQLDFGSYYIHCVKLNEIGNFSDVETSNLVEIGPESDVLAVGFLQHTQIIEQSSVTSTYSISVASSSLYTDEVYPYSFDVVFTEHTGTNNDYYLYSSYNNNLTGSIDNIEQNGVLQDTGNDVSRLTVDKNITDDTDVYVNIIVDDNGGGKGFYTSTSQHTPAFGNFELELVELP